MAKQERVPVLIVGGGIVGLSASLLLSNLGVKSLLVERHVGVSIHPRARSLNARTMEIFRTLGIDKDIKAASSDLGPSKGIYKGKTLASVVESHKRRAATASSETPGKGIIYRISPGLAGVWATQDLTEPVLLAKSRGQDEADIRFYTECTEVEQSDSQVTVQLRDRKTDERSTVIADYVISADGAGSPMRRSLGVKSLGKGVLGHLLNILFEADLSGLVNGREFSLCVIDRPELFGMFASINNKNRWTFHLSYDPSKGTGAADYTPERCVELIRLAVGIRDLEIKIVSVLPWQSAVRVAETFQRGRIFFAGDSSAQMPPWGGQGANSGIASVHNLTWKLAAVLRGQATPALLETYSTERFPVCKFAADKSGEAADERGIIDVSYSALFRLVRRAPRLVGYGYSYTSRSIIPDEDAFMSLRLPWSPVGWIMGLNGRPGTRCPHLWLRPRDTSVIPKGEKGQRVSPLDLCKGRLVLLCGADDGAAWKAAASKVSTSMELDLSTYTIGASATNDLIDDGRWWEYIAGTSTRGALLVRPDGFVSWRSYGQPADVEGTLERVFGQVLCR